jgi:glycine/D-amino acid oxidase-like deaminating enzyme
MRVAVVGGGIQGACVALELAERGVNVELFEAKHAVMDGASRHSEGKIHLGFVYANDPSLETASLQARGAGSFLPLMRRWFGDAVDDVGTSDRFRYVVHEDSLLSARELENVYTDIGQLIRSSCSEGAYFGIEQPWQFERLDDLVGYGEQATAAFLTREIAIDPDAIADLIAKRLVDTPEIEIRTDSRVIGVDTRGRTLSIVDADGVMSVTPRFEHVVNCAWSGRPRIDSTVGMEPRFPWSFRMKYFLRTSHDLALPSSTIVLGPFGEVVRYPSGHHYLSWYPVCRRGWSTDLEPPAWPTRLGRRDSLAMIQQTLELLGQVVPAVTRIATDTIDVRGGIIYALGDTDVDDPASHLHRRSEVGITTVAGWYHSIDTGKYTTAPLFAKEAVDVIAGTRGTPR